MEGLALPTDYMRIHKVRVFRVVVLFLIVYTLPVYCQFADLPHDAKTIDIGVNGDRASRTLSFSAVPAVTFSLSTRLNLRLSGSITYNSEPLTEKWHYKYLSMLRITL